MKAKRFWKKLLIVLGMIALCAGLLAITTNVIYNNFVKKDESNLIESYEIKKEKCELLKSLPMDFIEEGKGINLQEIPENIRYEIENKSDGNIEFYYYIGQEDNSNYNPYYARITLSGDFEIISEVYGMDLEDFETYKQQQSRGDMLVACLSAMIVIGLICFIIIGTIFIICIIKILIKRKSQSREERPIE